MLAVPHLVVAKLAEIFDNLGIAYLVGGSLASSVHGIPRSTEDVDLIADVKTSQVDALVKALAVEFYADINMVSDAIERTSSFNVIYLSSMFKADIFIQRDDAWSRQEMARALSEVLDLPDGSVTVRFAGPEDTLLHKLVWYKLGNEVSDRQWNDIIGIIDVQGDSLDAAYLDQWAPVLGVRELLERARGASQASI